MALGRAAFLNSVYMLIGNSGQMIASLGVFLYLARVLSPADFGAMGIAAAIVDLLTVFGRFGQVEALLQKGASDQRIVEFMNGGYAALLKLREEGVIKAIGGGGLIILGLFVRNKQELAALMRVFGGAAAALPTSTETKGAT